MQRRGERRLSHDEAEAVLMRHFAPGAVEAVVRSGCYVVRWWPTGDAGLGPELEPLEGESLESFAGAVRDLARQRPYLVRTALDEPLGLMARLTEGRAGEALAVVLR